MRWIFLVLLLVNLGVFAWSWLDREDSSLRSAEPASAPFVYRNLPELEILTADHLAGAERSSPSSLSRNDAPESADPAFAKQGKPLCEMVGVFDSLASAKLFSDRLVAIDIDHTVQELDVSGGDRHWVYLEAGESKTEVMERLAGLQAQGIDSYYIPRGELANTISLGVFSREQLALARVMAMEAKGLAPKIRVKPQTYREIWVMLSPGEHKKMSDLTWSRVLEGNNSLERRQNFCLDVAS